MLLIFGFFLVLALIMMMIMPSNMALIMMMNMPSNKALIMMMNMPLNMALIMMMLIMTLNTYSCFFKLLLLNCTTRFIAQILQRISKATLKCLNIIHWKLLIKSCYWYYSNFDYYLNLSSFKYYCYFGYSLVLIILIMSSNVYHLFFSKLLLVRCY